MSQTVRITTGARLHFGLLDIAAPFGGCGVMIDRPGTTVEVVESSQFEFVQDDGSVDHRERTWGIARRLAAGLGLDDDLPAVRVRIVQSAPPHTGLGSGTQLSLAISEAMLRVIQPDVWDSTSEPIALLHQREMWFAAADRGRRSAVGTHGYLAGGFIAEGLAPSDPNSALNAIDTRFELPGSWRVAILVPAADAAVKQAVSGDQEHANFAALPPVSTARRATLASLLMESLIPAIEHADFLAFCDAVTHYNRSSGELFAGVQGGAYNGETTTRLIKRLIDAGNTGVGQSSWGPGVFVWHPNVDAADAFQREWGRDGFHVIVTQPKPNGRLVETV